MTAVWTMLCLASLFRRQWEEERLSYPIAEIPVQLIRDRQRCSAHASFGSASHSARPARSSI